MYITSRLKESAGFIFFERSEEVSVYKQREDSSGQRDGPAYLSKML